MNESDAPCVNAEACVWPVPPQGFLRGTRPLRWKQPTEEPALLNELRDISFASSICGGYLEYPFEKSSTDADSIALVRYISCDRLEAFLLHFME
jgi:hypothetical protein